MLSSILNQQTALWWTDDMSWMHLVLKLETVFSQTTCYRSPHVNSPYDLWTILRNKDIVSRNTHFCWVFQISVFSFWSSTNRNRFNSGEPEVWETDISKWRQMKPKLSALLDTTTTVYDELWFRWTDPLIGLQHKREWSRGSGQQMLYGSKSPPSVCRAVPK